MLRAGELGADADQGGGPQLPAGGDDPLHLIGLLDHHHRLAAEPTGQDRRLDVALVLVAVADQQGLGIVDQGEGDQQFRLAAGLQAEMPLAAALHQLFHHMALLVALHRKHALVAAAVAVLGDGPLKGGMEPLQPVFENVVEADQQRQGEIAPLKALHQLHQIQAATPLPPRLHHHVPAGAHGEIGLTPAVEAVEPAAVGHAPAIAGRSRRGRSRGSGRPPWPWDRREPWRSGGIPE